MAGRSGVREGYWRSVLRDWQRSGLTLAEFARERELNYWTLWDWKKRLGVVPKMGARGRTTKRPRSDKQPVPEFVPVRLVDSSGGGVATPVPIRPSRVEVVLRCGRGIRFDDTCSLPFVASVVSLLEGC